MVKTCIDKVYRDLYILRLDDDETRYFEGLWSIPEGITYNSYLLVTNQGAILFDTWKHSYSSLFLEALERVVDLRDIRYLVVHHMEPDHSGALPLVIRENPSVTVIGHRLVENMIKSFYGVETRFKPVSSLEGISIGGYNLEFIHAPWLHWPETIMTYIHEHKLLLSCDAFGAYSIPPTITDQGVDLDRYMWYARKYFATIIGRYRGFVVKAIEKILSLGLEIEAIAPSHGIVWTRNSRLIIDAYHKWGIGEHVSGKAVIVYSSMYGFLEEAIGYVKDSLEEKGYVVLVYRYTDMEHSRISDLIGEAYDSELIVIGVSTYESTAFPLINYIVDLIASKIPAKKVLLVTAYGWGGNASKIIADKLVSKGFNIVDTIEFKGRIVDTVVARIREAIEKL